MRTVDPNPAQIATMDKRTVLKLLGLLTTGNLLRQGTKTVDVGASRWAWSLLAKLPERGELTSEEIGVVRELGKKAVLIGMGLKTNTDMNEGIAEIEAGLEDEEVEEVVPVVNEEEIDLEDDGEEGEVLDVITPLTSGFDSSTGLAMASDGNITAEKETLAHIDDAGILPLGTTSAQDELAAAKAQMLQALDSPNPHLDAKEELKKAEEHQTTPDDSKNWNTKATIDMTLTVAGEIFGQRDLLEFRKIWDQAS